jgi:short-subunit dehydrogenase involved in D-alanine esterification of teichoic acids
MQLADTRIQVIELIPPGVRTTLMHQENSDIAMPLDDFLTEVIQILESHPDAQEILVEKVKFLRNAVADRKYDQILGMFSRH